MFLIGSVCAVVGILAKVPETPVLDVLSSAAHVAILAVALFGYMGYLFFAMDGGILRKPIGRTRIRAHLLAFLTFGAYLCMPLEPLAFDNKHYISNTAFAIVYYGWLIHSFCEWYAVRNVKGSHQANAEFWLVVDIVLCLVMTFNVVAYYILNRTTEPPPAWAAAAQVNFKGFGLKDLVIVISVFTRAIVMRFSRQSSYDNYRLAMCDFVDMISETDRGRQSLGMDVVKTVLQKRGGADGMLKVFDFGAGNSVRTLRFLEKYGAALKNISLFRYDNDDGWAAMGVHAGDPHGLSEVHFTSRFSKAMEWIKDADIVVASHSLYTHDAVDDFVRLVRANAKPDVLIIARGGSPESFLAPLVTYRMFSWLRPFYSAVWDTDVIPYICHECHLGFIDSGGALQAHPAPFFLAQDIIIKNTQDRERLTTATRLMYGGGIADSFGMILQRFDHLNRQHGKDHIELPHGDLIFLMVKSENSAVPHGTRGAAEGWKEPRVGVTPRPFQTEQGHTAPTPN